MKKIDVAIALVQHKDKFLILQRQNDAWTFPSGKVPIGERLRDGALREVKEETGVDASIKRYLGKVETEDVNLHYFHCDYIAGDAHLAEPDKFKAFHWATRDQIRSVTGASLSSVVAEFFLKNAKQSQMRKNLG